MEAHVAVIPSRGVADQFPRRRDSARPARSHLSGCGTPPIDVPVTAEGDRIVGVRVAQGWGADTSTRLPPFELRTDAGDASVVSLSTDLTRTLVGDVTTGIDIVRNG